MFTLKLKVEYRGSYKPAYIKRFAREWQDIDD
jgi:hypothetical protein